MLEFIDLYAEYLSKQRKIFDTDSTTADITSTESDMQFMLNIDDKILEILKSSFQVLSYPPNIKRKFVKKNPGHFERLAEKINKALKNEEEITDTEYDNNIALVLTAYNFGKVVIQITERNRDSKTVGKKVSYAIADSYFTLCLHLCSIITAKKWNIRKLILIYMRVVDRIVYIWMNQQQFDLCYELLLRALRIYVHYTQNNKYLNPVDVATILGIDDTEDKELDTKVSLDNLHIENLKRLYLVYNNNPNNKYEYVAHMHVLLNTLIKEVFLHKNYVEWAMAATELSRYFIQHKRFTEARQYLAAASYMMEKGKTEHFATTKEKTTSDNQNSTEKLRSDLLDDQHQSQRAKFTKLWGQYGLQLLSASKQNLLKNITNQSYEADNLEHSDSTKSNEEPNKQSQEMLIFTDLEDELKDTITKISDKYLLNYHDFKMVVENVLEWFNAAIEYFTVKRDAKTYGEIILQMSLAYKYFADFERHKDKRLNIYKQQIALLHNALEKISDNTAMKDIKKLILLELGISNATVLNIKINDEIRMYNKIPNWNILEMKNSMRNSMNFFTSYLACVS